MSSPNQPQPAPAEGHGPAAWDLVIADATRAEVHPTVLEAVLADMRCGSCSTCAEPSCGAGLVSRPAEARGEQVTF